MASTAAGTLPPLSFSVASAIFLLAVASSLAPVAANLDGDALAALRSGLRDPDGVLESWDTSLVDPCTWFHITCDDDTNRVIRIDLAELNLSGPLAPELGKLDQLKYMEIQGNNIQGTIPEEFGNLANLISLDLFNNNISGHIPSSLGKLKSLQFLRMDHNSLTGLIPRELVGLSKLRIVDLSNNDLCGTIPTSGPFQNIPLSSFANNPRLEGPELQGLGAYDTNC